MCLSINGISNILKTDAKTLRQTISKILKVFHLLSVQQLLEKSVDPEFPDFNDLRRPQADPD